MKFKFYLFFIFFFVFAFTLIMFLVLISTVYKTTEEVGRIKDSKVIPKEKSIDTDEIMKNLPQPTEVENTVTQYEKYLIHHRIFATMFWVGEKATHSNDYIPNMTSAWDEQWLERFGGIDNPYERDGYNPKDFIPKENPFYFALPYNDFSESGRKENARYIPWYSSNVSENYSFLKNRWIKVTYKSKSCYAQWEDVGPFEIDDFDYVFNGKKPLNDRAGIDLSPAMRTCLRMAINDYVSWNFIEADDVPDGPWLRTVTKSGTNWQ